jgi:putative PIN family toxin of toxin-antitoxin system
VLRVTLDTNVYVSGLNFKGKPYELLELTRAGQLEVSVSEAILSELHRVLHDKFKWPESDIAIVERQIRGAEAEIRCDARRPGR